MQLITGGMGFIGLHTARNFLDAGERVVVTRYRKECRPLFLEGEWNTRLFAEPLDLTDERAVIDIVERHEVKGIVHLVVPVLAGVAETTLSGAEEFRVNMMGLINVLKAAQVGRVNRLAIASSVSVYAGLKEGPFTEDMALPVASGNPTEAFKKSFEILAGITPIKPELTSYFYALVAYTVHFTTVFPTSLRA